MEITNCELRIANETKARRWGGWWRPRGTGRRRGNGKGMGAKEWEWKKFVRLVSPVPIPLPPFLCQKVLPGVSVFGCEVIAMLAGSGGGLPVAEGVFEGFGDGAQRDAGGEEFGDVEDAVGAGGFGGGLVEFGVAFPVGEGAGGPQDFLQQGDDLAGGDEAGVGEVVGAEGGAAFPEVEGGADEIGAVREGVHVVVHAGVLVSSPPQAASAKPATMAIDANLRIDKYFEGIIFFLF